jgi:hypothetical protein
MPQYRNGKVYDMHGEGVVPIGPALPFRGGIFGQPMLPQPRAGIFGASWALPWQDMADNTIGPGHNLLPDRYMRSSGWPVYGLGTNGEGIELGPGTSVGPMAMPPGGISGMIARQPLVVGALVGMLLSPKGKRIGGAALGAVLGGFGRAAAEALPMGRPGLDPVMGAAGTLAGAVLAGYLRRGTV